MSFLCLTNNGHMKRKQKEYYIVIEKISLKIGVFVEKTQVSKYLNVSYKTFLRNFKGGIWETEDFVVKHPDEFQEKSSRGDKLGRNFTKKGSEW